MRTSLLVLFAGLTIAAAVPVSPISSLLERAHTHNVQVSGTFGVLRVIVLLFLSVIIQPFIVFVLRQMTLPFRFFRFMAYLPHRMVRFFVTLPQRIMHLPITLINLPMIFITLVRGVVKRIISPISRVLTLIIEVLSFIFGAPVTAFDRIYTYV
ncbi:uncharacterized protein LOC123009933 [Tribolium madens]|uniref:uncharacterized protein LOC123009933 n=1 Tax=Tribolium madens TaxID=41895 RepID=UPI001CF7321C|nr:uncharacterized protein LOC123009933 [Tribolium madens]